MIKRERNMMLRVALGLSSMVFAVACGSRELSRKEAASIIQTRLQANTEYQAQLSKEGFRQGEQQGLWSQQGKLSEKGKKHFAQIVQFGNATLVQALKKSVLEVSGIADAVLPFSGASKDGFKEVQFTWEYSDVQPIPRRVIVRGGSGTAILRRFDDGWRVEHIETRISDQPFALTAEEQRAAEEDVRLEIQRKSAEEQSRRAETAARNLLITQATTSTREVGQCRTVDNNTPTALHVTDVGFSAPPQNRREMLTISFASVRAIETSMYGNQNSIEIPLTESAYGWGFRWKAIFFDRAERDRCYTMLSGAHDAWKAKYPTFVNVGIAGIQKR